MSECGLCDGSGQMRVDGHEMPCTCLRGIDTQVEAAQAHLQALVAQQRTALIREEWSWLDRASLQVGEVTASPCGRWWARAQCYDLLGESDLEVWLSEPDDTCVDGWVASMVRVADGWALHDALPPRGAERPTTLRMSGAMASGLRLTDERLLGEGGPVTIDGVTWAPRGIHEWTAGGLALVQHTPGGWSYSVGMWGSSRRATGLEGGALPALWRATYALRLAVREVGL